MQISIRVYNFLPFYIRNHGVETFESIVREKPTNMKIFRMCYSTSFHVQAQHGNSCESSEKSSLES